MTKTTLQIVSSLSTRRNIAMCHAGISPQLLAIKPGTRVERNRRAEHRLGRIKHKASRLDW